jgi:hypothetical protein
MSKIIYLPSDRLDPHVQRSPDTLLAWGCSSEGLT